MNQVEKFKNILFRYLPEEVVEYIFEILYEHEVHLKVSKTRNTKLGDYRSPYDEKGHRITVNGDLNRYEFLITLLHEIAHMLVWIKYKNQVKPHGQEWKDAFRDLLKEMLAKNVFPEDVVLFIKKAFFSGKGFSTASLDQLKLVLKQYSENPITVVQDIPDDHIFTLRSGRSFKKIKQLRKRYHCEDLETGKIYSIHPHAEVISHEKTS